MVYKTINATAMLAWVFVSIVVMSMGQMSSGTGRCDVNNITQVQCASNSSLVGCKYVKFLANCVKNKTNNLVFCDDINKSAIRFLLRTLLNNEPSCKVDTSGIFETCDILSCRTTFLQDLKTAAESNSTKQVCNAVSKSISCTSPTSNANNLNCNATIMVQAQMAQQLTFGRYAGEPYNCDDSDVDMSSFKSLAENGQCSYLFQSDVRKCKDMFPSFKGPHVCMDVGKYAKCFGEVSDVCSPSFKKIVDKYIPLLINESKKPPFNCPSVDHKDVCSWKTCINMFIANIRKQRGSCTVLTSPIDCLLKLKSSNKCNTNRLDDMRIAFELYSRRFNCDISQIKHVGSEPDVHSYCQIHTCQYPKDETDCLTGYAYIKCVLKTLRQCGRATKLVLEHTKYNLNETKSNLDGHPQYCADKHKNMSPTVLNKNGKCALATKCLTDLFTVVKDPCKALATSHDCFTTERKYCNAEQVGEYMQAFEISREIIVKNRNCSEKYTELPKDKFGKCGIHQCIYPLRRQGTPEELIHTCVQGQKYVECVLNHKNDCPVLVTSVAEYFVKVLQSLALNKPSICGNTDDHTDCQSTPKCLHTRHNMDSLNCNELGELVSCADTQMKKCPAWTMSLRRYLYDQRDKAFNCNIQIDKDLYNCDEKACWKQLNNDHNANKGKLNCQMLKKNIDCLKKQKSEFMCLVDGLVTGSHTKRLMFPRLRTDPYNCTEAQTNLSEFFDLKYHSGCGAEYKDCKFPRLNPYNKPQTCSEVHAYRQCFKDFTFSCLPSFQDITEKVSGISLLDVYQDPYNCTKKEACLLNKCRYEALRSKDGICTAFQTLLACSKKTIANCNNDTRLDAFRAAHLITGKVLAHEPTCQLDTKGIPTVTFESACAMDTCVYPSLKASDPDTTCTEAFDYMDCLSKYKNNAACSPLLMFVAHRYTKEVKMALLDRPYVDNSVCKTRKNAN